MKPAARITDQTSCPASTGNTPHKGGPILSMGTKPTVFIGSKNTPAAVVGDKAQCNGPLDTVKTGSRTVFIGPNKSPAARKGDRTEHGGIIMGGCDSVKIG